MDLEVENGSVVCALLILPSESQDVVLGEPFLRGFYTNFDYDQYRVGFKPIRQPFPWWIAIGAGIGIFILVAILIYCCVKGKCCKEAVLRKSRINNSFVRNG